MPSPSEPTNARFARITHWADLLLPLWFLGWSLSRIYGLGWTGREWDLSFIGRDFWIYRNAGDAVLSGADPWLASYAWSGVDWHFAALPTAAQLFVPFALIGDVAAFGLFLALSIGVAWLGLRRLGLAAWWLLFPPMTEGLLAGNPQILLFGLVVVGGSLAGGAVGGAPRTRFGATAWSACRAIAVGLKIYAIAPIVARREWRAVIAVAVLLAASIALGPDLWARYLTEFGSISSRIVAEAKGGLSAAMFLRPSVFSDLLPGSESAAVVAGLILYGIIALLVLFAALRDVEGAGWLVAPVLFPSAQYHLATMALPAARRLAIWVIAIPTIPTYLLGLIILTYQVTAGHRPIVTMSAPVPLRQWLGLGVAGSVSPMVPEEPSAQPR